MCLRYRFYSRYFQRVFIKRMYTKPSEVREGLYIIQASPPGADRFLFPIVVFYYSFLYRVYIIAIGYVRVAHNVIVYLVIAVEITV